MAQQFCLKWNNHMNNMMDVFKNLLSNESMVDVTLACDGLSLKAHKIVLSACSPFFQSLFLENPCKHPIVILKDMKYSELKAIIEFMYHGEVNVAQDQLSALMKTAETLRVKGLAEMPNEKSSSNASQEEPGHRSVPRTETPPPSSKRRRGRVRKRSLSDSNRSDDSNETKIKQPPSPDIEELSGDVTMDTSGQFSNLQSQVPMQSLPSHSTNSFQKASSVVSQDPQIEEPASADESEFGVEPAKLLEQTLTTDDLSNARRSGRSSVSSGMEMQRRPRSSTDHSSNLVPTSMPSEALGSNQQPESPPDIKPELLELDPPMSPVAGPSHSTDNSMMMYMDQSSVSSHPGTSYQDNTALVPQDSQPQGSCVIRTIYFSKNEATGSSEEKEAPKPKKKWNYKCNECNLLVASRNHLQIHMRTHTGERPFSCHLCGKTSIRQHDLQLHMRTHTGIKPFVCPVCGMKFNNCSNYRRHFKRRHPTAERLVQVCNLCNEQFDSKELLNGHLINEHGVYNTHVCLICRKSYKRYYDLKTHMRVHSKEQPYSCNICLKPFRYKSNHSRHIRQHHKLETDALQENSAFSEEPDNSTLNESQEPEPNSCE